MATNEITATAAAELLNEIAGHAVSIDQLFHELLEEPQHHFALCTAGAALAGKVGYIADQASRALKPELPRAGFDFLMSPRGQQAMETLRAGVSEPRAETVRGATAQPSTAPKPAAAPESAEAAFRALLLEFRSISEPTVTDGTSTSRDHDAMISCLRLSLSEHLATKPSARETEYLRALARLLCEAVGGISSSEIAPTVASAESAAAAAEVLQ